MAPLLIDNRDLLKLVLVSVVAVSTVFAGGVFVGHQRAASFYQAGVDIQPLPLPEPASVVENIFDSQQPEEVEAGEYIDVDDPVTAEVGVTVDETRVTAKDDIKSSLLAVAASSSHPVLGVKEKKKAIPATVKTQYKSNAVSDFIGSIPLNGRVRDINENRLSATPLNTERPMAVALARADSLDVIKYSIQAGVYGRLANAENMMKQLRSDQYEAYITDYMNKKNETRYNVRFGYFVNKKSALASLEKFKRDKNADGYLVKFSADNIVNLADATETSDGRTPPVQIDGLGDSSTPRLAPSVTMTDKISQLDVSTEKLIQTN